MARSYQDVPRICVISTSCKIIRALSWGSRSFMSWQGASSFVSLGVNRIKNYLKESLQRLGKVNQHL